ncbi:MAG TPA: NAD(P)/FAD-dependent oxidoreductase [Gemmatimonadales bacterium]|nr:NAD(P)/FAD-dependent oxidoreductase [Gemmatimonadales bacterium]
MTTGRWDAIVIGAGVHGLVAAHYLARTGRRVLVFEQRGAPDSSRDTGWVPPQLIRELGLQRDGLRIDRTDPWITAALPNDGRLELSADIARSVEAIRRLSPRDAAKWPEFCARMARLAGVLEALYLQPAPDVETRELGELWRLARLGLQVRRLGKQAVIDLARILPMSIAELLDDWFETDALKGVLGALAVWHLKQGPRSGGTAFNLLHHHVGSPPGVFRPPRSNLTEVLSALPGVEVRRGEKVGRILVKAGTAAGVALAPSGAELAARVVVSAADPRATFAAVDPGELEPEFVRAVGNIKCRGVTARVTLTAKHPPDFSTWCVAPSLAYLERAYDDAKYGRVSAQPYVEAHAADRRVEVHVQYVPYEASADGIGDAAVRAVTTRFPELERQIAGREVLTPRDLQARYGTTEGHLYHGELTLDQILFMRPLPGWSRYRTPIRGLYLCGAGTHPGGGIAGAAGRNAARVILKDTKRS